MRARVAHDIQGYFQESLPDREAEDRRMTAKISFLRALIATVLILTTPAAVLAAPGGPAVVVPDSPLIEAIRRGNIEEVQAALVRGQSVDARDKTGVPALMVALIFDQKDMFRFLLENGARVTAKDRDGDTVLHLLANSRDVELAELVLEAGADPDRFGANREPPLIMATRSGSLPMVELLLNYDVDYLATDLTGRSALMIAEEGRNRGIAEVLRAAGAY